MDQPRRQLLIAGMAGLVALTGCASKFETRPMFRVPVERYETLLHKPDKNVPATVQVGESMVSTAKVAAMPLMVTSTTYRGKAPYRNSQQIAVDVPAGPLRLIAEDLQGGHYYAAAAGVALAYDSNGNGVFTPDSNVRGGVFLPRDGTPHLYWAWDGSQNPNVLPAPQLKFQMTTAAVDASSIRFKRELVYTGISQTTIGVLYREFADGMARPSFSQELRYDMAQGAVIGYKGARFEVLKADNTGITYRVLSHLELLPE